MPISLLSSDSIGNGITTKEIELHGTLHTGAGQRLQGSSLTAFEQLPDFFLADDSKRIAVLYQGGSSGVKGRKAVIGREITIDGILIRSLLHLVMSSHDTSGGTCKDNITTDGILIADYSLTAVSVQLTDCIEKSLGTKVLRVSSLSGNTAKGHHRGIMGNIDGQRCILTQGTVVHHPAKVFAPEVKTCAQRNEVTVTVIDNRLQTLQGRDMPVLTDGTGQ